MKLPVLLASAVLVLTGCTAGAGDPGASTPSSTASPSSAQSSSSSSPAGESGDTTPEPTSAPPAPRAPTCYRLTFAQLPRTSNDSDPVPCTERHDAQTIHVDRFDTNAAGETIPVDSDRARAQLSRTCTRRKAAFLGGTREARNLSRFEVVWFSPTPQQVEDGADWFRCDLVALAGDDTLHRLPPPRRAAGLLDRDDALATYGLCGTAKPGTERFERVICARRHSWRAIGTIRLPGPARYPGTATIRRLGDQPCRDRVSDLADDPLEFEYGWEWPTREQWRNGQRFGYCWSPD